MKLDWELHSGNNALWCRVMEGKYNRANMERLYSRIKSTRLVTVEDDGPSVA